MSFTKPINPVLQTSNPLANGLARCFLFNEGGGTTIHDYSTNNDNLTTRSNLSTSGLVWGNDPTYGSYITFNGVDQDARGVDTSIPHGTSSRTLAFLVTKDAGGDYFFGYGGNSSGLVAAGITASIFEWVITSNVTQAHSNLYVNDSDFHLLVAAISGGFTSFYMDGATGVTTNLSVNYNTTSNGFMYLGQAGGSGGSNSDGTQGIWANVNMAGAWIWNRALSTSEVVNLQSDPWQMIRGNNIVPSESPIIFIPNSGEPTKFFTGGSVFGGGTLLDTKLFDNYLGNLNYPYKGLHSGRSDNLPVGGPSVTTAISSGTFAAMQANKYVILTFNASLARIPTSVLHSASKFASKSQNKNIGWVDTKLINRTGGWLYTNGLPVNPQQSRDNIHIESQSNYATPGRFTFLTNNNVITASGYQKKNN